MLALHLLQSSLVFINTQLLQAVLRDPQWAAKLADEDWRALSPLFWSHVNPYLDKLQTCYVAGPAGSAVRSVSVMPRHLPQSFVDQKAGSVELMFARSGSSGSPGSSSGSVGDQAPVGMGVTSSSAA